MAKLSGREMLLSHLIKKTQHNWLVQLMLDYNFGCFLCNRINNKFMFKQNFDCRTTIFFFKVQIAVDDEFVESFFFLWTFVINVVIESD